MARIHPLDAARAEVLRYASLVASWNEAVITTHSSLAASELQGLRDAVGTLRRMHPYAFDGE